MQEWANKQTHTGSAMFIFPSLAWSPQATFNLLCAAGLHDHHKCRQSMAEVEEQVDSNNPLHQYLPCSDTRFPYGN